MTPTTIHREVALKRTPRTMQVSAAFDVEERPTSESAWTVHMPLDERDWQIGLIVGPSGAGKSTVAAEIFGVPPPMEWDPDAAIVDAFPKEMGIKEVTGLLSSVGFGSIPAWLRPYRALSTGEQFRVSMARALAEHPDLCVVDEFTSVVDRRVAQIAASAVAKRVRRGAGKFVAVSCHYDIVEWLQPDWIYEPHLDRFAWRLPQRRPGVDLGIHPIDRAVWPLFAPHHYLTREIAKGAVCFGGFVDGECVAFASYIHFPHPKVRDIKMGHRHVVLPDWQGIGIAGAMVDWIGADLHRRGYRFHHVVSNPAMIHFLSRSPRWRLTRVGRGPNSGKNSRGVIAVHQNAFSIRRMQYAFEYVPDLGHVEDGHADEMDAGDPELGGVEPLEDEAVLAR